MPKTNNITAPKDGDVLFNVEEKVFPDHKAEKGDKAYIFMHTVPFEGSVGLVNMLTATRLVRKGFDVHFVLFGPGVLMAAATRGYPAVGNEGFPGNLGYNKQLKTLMDEGATVYACRFAMGALYGMREDDLIEGVKAFNPLDVLDANIQAWKDRALVLATWTV
ncbi:MAG: MSMEG_0572/Sll0783 family nitrogen starvation response protein [Pseudomonadales bacterium]